MGKWWKLTLIVLVFLTSVLVLAKSDPKWIWFPDAAGVKGESRYFRTVFELDEIPFSLLARVVASQRTTVFLNGEKLREIRPDEILGSVELVDSVKVGKNVLAIEITAEPEDELQPLLVSVVDIDDNIVLGTDETWKAANREVAGWYNIAFDDSTWANVLVSSNMTKPQISSRELVTLMGEFAPKEDKAILENAAIWATHTAEFVFNDTLPQDTTKITALTGTNQAASAQLAIRTTQDISALEVEFTDLKQKDGNHIVGKDNFKYNFIDTWYMTKNSTETPMSLLIAAPKAMPDILTEKLISSVPKDYTQPIYLSFFIPKGTPSGIYQGRVLLKTIEASRELPVEIEVLPVELPDETNMKVTIWFQPDYIVQYNKVSMYSDEFWEIIEYYAQLMQKHRQNMVWTPLGLINLTYDEAGVLTGDFSKFDRWIETFFSHGFKYIELSHVGGRVGDWSSDFTYWKRQAYDKALKTTRDVTLKDYMHLVQEHLRENGWLEVAYAHIADEPTPANYPSWIDLAKEVKAGAPELKTMEALHYTNLSDYLDVAIPQLDYFDQNKNRLLKEQEDGKIELWFYTCWLPQGNYPNRLLDYPLYKTRILHWANFLYDATGYLHWGYNWWRAFEVGYAPGDGWIVYPTEENLVPSVRYEAMREGIEDYEYLLLHAKKTQALAKELGVDIHGDYRAKEIAGSIMESLTRYTEDPKELLKAREKLLRELVELDNGPKALLVLDVSENTVLRDETLTDVLIYTEEGCKVTLNGEGLKETSPGRYISSMRITPEANRIVVEVVKGDQIKTLERIYNNWRIIR